MLKPIVCLMGPTASGKTAIACELVRHLPFEIVSVDSAMVYRGLDIGTAKPDASVLQNAPHHLIDCCLPTEAYSAAQFCLDATDAIASIQNRGKWPLLVGGTMMYFKALQEGLSDLPEADARVRAELTAQYQAEGATFMHAWLTRVDAISAERIHVHDTQRTQRALEVYVLTGKPLSWHVASHRPRSNGHYVNLGLFPARRVWLHARIAQRFNDMLAQGFLSEVAGLIQDWGLTEQSLAMRSVGYRQACQYLRGGTDYATFQANVLAATRQLAKRQLTWLRSWQPITLYDSEVPDCASRILASLEQIVDNGG